MEKRIEKTLSALERNNIHAIYAETAEDACREVEKLLFDGCSITAGGSVSLHESGVWDIINRPCYNFSDRNREGITPEEREAVFKSVIGCDFYFCSSNAVTENGELINVDGFANRISAIAFGPKRVIMIVGKNKLVENIDEGLLRIKKSAAPKNCVRLGINNPCAKLGHCIAFEKSDRPLMTDGCSAERRICRNYLVSSIQGTKDRITVILCNENLGY